MNSNMGIEMKKIIINIIFISLMILLFTTCVGQTKIIAISSGTISVLALDDKGNVWVWGDGIPPESAWKLPIDNVTAIASGGMCNYTLRGDGTVWAWGNGRLGGLGNGDTGIQTIPVQVTGLTDVIAISASGVNGYALKNDGTVWAWGYNRDGDLGIGTYDTSYVSTPVQVHGLTSITGIYNINGVHYALKSDGTLWAWGDNTFANNSETGCVSHGTLGDESRPGVQPLPFLVPDVSDVKQVGSDSQFTIFLKNDGTVWGWGDNEYGQLGDGTKTYVCLPNGTWVEQQCILPPVQAKITDVKQIAVGMSNVVALKNDGTVWEWGESVIAARYGGLSSVLLPTQLSGLDHVVQVCHGLALKDDGTVWGWGTNFGKKIINDREDRLVTSPVLVFKRPEQAATPTPIISPTTSPAPTIILSNTSTNSTTQSENPVANHLTTPAPPGKISPADTNMSPSDDGGLILVLAGVVGIVLMAGAVLYLFITKRL